MQSKKNPPRRGIEPRSPARQAGILTTILSRIDEAVLSQLGNNVSILFILSLDHKVERGLQLMPRKLRRKSDKLGINILTELSTYE